MRATMVLVSSLAAALSVACGGGSPTAVGTTDVPKQELRDFDELLVKAWTGTARSHSAVVAVETRSGVICTWAYGLTSDYGMVTTHTDEAMATPHTIHEVEFTDLEPNTLYHYRVIGVAPDGTIYRSSDATFRTVPE